jgi:adenine-specific DNA-methyltransferase
MAQWLLAVIDEAAQLAAPHVFPEPRQFKGADGKVLASVCGLQEAVAMLKRLSRPFLNWAGKAERLSFDVPTLPLFVHERLSTKAIIETLTEHRRDRDQKKQLLIDLFSDPQRSIADHVLRAYEHRDQWVNRMILGDSLVVMNSLVHYESLGGQVQMIYMDPPYGVKFGSNFQPFVRRRDVKHNDDEDLTREPEMVQAYRDTWELGLHSYLTYLRDRLLVARELLAPSGSLFVQISDENLHHVREVMDEIFGPENFVAQIATAKTSGQADTTLAQVADFILWYAKDAQVVKTRKLFQSKELGGEGASKYTLVELADGTRTTVAKAMDRDGNLPPGARPYRLSDMTSTRPRQPGDVDSYFYKGRSFSPGNRTFRTDKAGLDCLAEVGRLEATSNKLSFISYLDDFPVFQLTNVWTDIGGIQSRSDPKVYVVQTSTSVIERCLLMTTDPGDLVLDPTCVRKGTRVWVVEGAGEEKEGTPPQSPRGRGDAPSPLAGRAGVGAQILPPPTSPRSNPSVPANSFLLTTALHTASSESSANPTAVGWCEFNTPAAPRPCGSPPTIAYWPSCGLEHLAETEIGRAAPSSLLSGDAHCGET